MCIRDRVKAVNGFALVGQLQHGLPSLSQTLIGRRVNLHRTALTGNGIQDVYKRQEALIASAYSRAVLCKVRDENGGLQYQVTDFYSRFPYYAQFEYEEYVRIPRARRELLNQWDLEVYMSQYEDVVKAKMRGEDCLLYTSRCV